MLDPTQIEPYHRNGNPFVPDVPNHETSGVLKRVSQEFVAQAARVTRSNEMYDIDPGPMIRRLNHAQRPRYRGRSTML